MITIIDYGSGNINAFANVFKRLNLKAKIARSKDDLSNATHIVLPGVGAFDHVMSCFNQSGLRDVVERKIFDGEAKVIGICAGMQILATGSDEGTEKGLGWIDGHVRLFNTSNIKFQTKLPHMGWNEINHNGHALLKDIDDNARFYFVHSYYFECNSKEDSIATTEYGFNFTSAVNKGNVYGVQFHPEKSHQNGQQLLKNFALL